MTSSLDRRLDGSLALFIDGDFGSADKQRTRAMKETRAMLLSDREEAVAYQLTVVEELKAYEACQDDDVQYGLHMLNREEAIQRAQQSLWKANLKIQTIDAQIARLTRPVATESDTTPES